ncbi:MAG: aspartate-semialdehyde dehydrogenase [Anaeromyxobacter sp.]|nr:aspartate-semialdehyde dehydrogenase [Anaeromyxobacter sp.]MBL0276518.1 aspartate-semialdehyde dehydrogenase [Anaeromyxobacter sp.]
MSSRPFSIALLGATGAIGRAVLEVLEDRDTLVSEVRLLATPASAGQEIDFRGDTLTVRAVDQGAFRGCDVALLCAGAEASRTWAPVARAEGALVVDDSAAFRDRADVPCVVPEVNGEALAGAAGLVCNPDPIPILLSLILKPLHAAAGLTQVICATYQSVSGAGLRGVEQLEREAADLMNGREPQPPVRIPHRIAFNLVPQLGGVGPDGVAEEEASIARETRRLLGLPDLPVSATAVRVPVFYGHAVAVHLGLARPLSLDAARLALRAAPSVKVLDQPAEGVYPMPMLAVNDDAALVGRLRADAALPNGLALFAAIDNLRKGGATNLVQVAEALMARRADV